ncbi:MAG: aminotransferase class I/II-fold pyridoxal phosphate-dependent enzyme, partial [Clostridia bacterium]|nr:aminotransferase class I/II-fold pyridoxal phosphate-dependent enzyme [Clostridia bacterium]
MSKFLIDKLKSLEAYVPGEQPRDKKYIKLNTNESPYPPSKHTIDSINKAEVENLKLYSDPTCKLLKEKIADKFGVLPENVYVGNGSDECLNFFFMAFCDNVVFPDITYGFYNVFAQLYAINYKEIPLTEDFSVNPKDYINVGANVVIANPNAPTGKTICLDEIEE